MTTDDDAPDVRLHGTGVSPGRADGAVRVARSLDDLPGVRAGDVLVCPTTSPAWTTAMTRCGAIVTETGGMLSHAAIVARELGIPAVVAATGATTILRSGARVTVDGSTGTVTVVRTAGGQP